MEMSRKSSFQKEKTKSLKGLTFGCVEWTIEDCFSKLKLKNEGIDPWKDILVMFHDLVVMFGQNNQNGWKVHMTKDVIA